MRDKGAKWMSLTVIPKILTVVSFMWLIRSLVVFSTSTNILSIQSTSSAAIKPNLVDLDISTKQEKLLDSLSSLDASQIRRQSSASDSATGLVAFVTFAHLKDTSPFDRFIFPSLETWLAKDFYFVVLNENWRDKYYNELCSVRDCSRVIPIFVDCPEGKFGASPCCKQEQGMVHVMERYPNYDFYTFHDDDSYFRRRHLDMFLRRIESKEIYLITLGGRQANRYLGQPGYARVRHRQYNCSADESFLYAWGQPVIYPSQTMQHIGDGFRAKGLTKQCAEFNVTHDAGNAIFHWMYSIPDQRIRFFMFPTRNELSTYGTHGVDRMIIDSPPGKRKGVRRAEHTRTMNMTEIHRKYTKMRFKLLPAVWNNVTGFHRTETFSKFGDPSTWGTTWHTMPTKDCLAG